MRSRHIRQTQQVRRPCNLMKRIIALRMCNHMMITKPKTEGNVDKNAKQIRNFQKKVKRMNLKICDLTQIVARFDTHKKERVECCRRYCQLCKDAHTWNPLYQYSGVSWGWKRTGKKREKMDHQRQRHCCRVVPCQSKSLCPAMQIIVRPSVHQYFVNGCRCLTYSRVFSKSVKEALRKKVRTMSEHARYNCSVVFTRWA